MVGSASAFEISDLEFSLDRYCKYEENPSLRNHHFNVLINHYYKEATTPNDKVEPEWLGHPEMAQYICDNYRDCNTNINSMPVAWPLKN